MKVIKNQSELREMLETAPSSKLGDMGWWEFVHETCPMLDDIVHRLAPLLRGVEEEEGDVKLFQCVGVAAIHLGAAQECIHGNPVRRLGGEDRLFQGVVYHEALLGDGWFGNWGEALDEAMEDTAEELVVHDVRRPGVAAGEIAICVAMLAAVRGYIWDFLEDAFGIESGTHEHGRPIPMVAHVTQTADKMLGMAHDMLTVALNDDGTELLEEVWSHDHSISLFDSVRDDEHLEQRAVNIVNRGADLIEGAA